MLSTKRRTITTLLLNNKSMYNSKNFMYHKYTGCPINAVRTFSDLGCREIILLQTGQKILSDNYLDYLSKIVRHSMVAIGYGGNICTLQEARKLHQIGFDKLIFSSSIFENAEIIRSCSNIWGNQSVSFVLNYDQEIGLVVGGRKKNVFDYVLNINQLVNLLKYSGVGEVILQDCNMDGSKAGIRSELSDFSKNFIGQFQVILSGGGILETDCDNNDEYAVNGVAYGTASIYQGLNDAVLPRT